MLEYGLLLFFPFLMIYAAASDLFSMTISNKVSLLLISGFMVFAFLMGFGLNAILWHWAAFGLILGCGFVLFSLGVMGGGDVKLAASTALWFGWEHLMEYLVLTSILGAVLTLLFVMGRAQFIPKFVAEIGWVARLYRSNQVPNGIALGAAALMVYPDTPWMQHLFSASG